MDTPPAIDILLKVIGVSKEDRERAGEFVMALPKLVEDMKTAFYATAMGVKSANDKLDILVKGPGSAETETRAAALIMGTLNHGDGDSDGGIAGGSSPVRPAGRREPNGDGSEGGAGGS